MSVLNTIVLDPHPIRFVHSPGNALFPLKFFSSYFNLQFRRKVYSFCSNGWIWATSGQFHAEVTYLTDLPTPGQCFGTPVDGKPYKNAIWTCWQQRTKMVTFGPKEETKDRERDRKSRPPWSTTSARFVSYLLTKDPGSCVRVNHTLKEWTIVEAKGRGVADPILT